MTSRRWATAFTVGLITTYFGYEVAHRRTHTHPPRGPYGRWSRRGHMHHHFGAPMRNFGVTTPVWDRLCGTYDEPGIVTVPRRMAPTWLLDETGEIAPSSRPTTTSVASDATGTEPESSTTGMMPSRTSLPKPDRPLPRGTRHRRDLDSRAELEPHLNALPISVTTVRATPAVPTTAPMTIGTEGLRCHSDAGSQFTSIRYGERLGELGALPSIGTVGDSFDNALAETVNGLYKVQLTADLGRGPGKRLRTSGTRKPRMGALA